MNEGKQNFVSLNKSIQFKKSDLVDKSTIEDEHHGVSDALAVNFALVYVNGLPHDEQKIKWKAFDAKYL